jgi:hypothetical protein
MTKLSTMAAIAASTVTMQSAGCPLIGAHVSYDVTLRRVPRSVMRSAIVAAGFPAIAKASVTSVTPAQGLATARTQLKPTGSLSVLNVGKSADNAPLELAIWRGDPEAGSSGDEPPTMGARVFVDQAGQVVARAPAGAVWPRPESDDEPTDKEQAIDACMGYARNLAARANDLVRYVETSDVTKALALVLDGLHGAKECNHGRGHFILARYVETWSKLSDALAPYGVKGHTTTLWGLADHVEQAREAAKDSFAEKIRDLRTRLSDASSGKGASNSALARSLDNCVALVNEAKLYQDILGDLQGKINADVDAVRKLFLKLQAGGRVTYMGADIDAPIMGESQNAETPAFELPEGAERMASGAIRLADGTVQLPAE